jgi:hypothetical protein
VAQARDARERGDELAELAPEEMLGQVRPGRARVT